MKTENSVTPLAEVEITNHNDNESVVNDNAIAPDEMVIKDSSVRKINCCKVL